MPTYAARNIQIVDDEGNVVPNCSIEVRSEASGSLVALYSDRSASSAIGNPATTDSEGFLRIHCVGGAYKIRAYLGSSGSPLFEKIWRYVAIGRAAESDAGSVPETTVDNTVPRFDGTGGELQTSGVTIDDSDNVAATTFIADEQSSVPATPSSGTQKLFVDASGRVWTKLSSGRVVPVSAGDGVKRWSFGATNNSTTVSLEGTGTTEDGTTTAILSASSNYFTRQDRVETLSAASTGANCGRRSVQNYFTSEFGFAFFRFGVEAFQTNMAMFVGVRPSGSHGNGDPSAFTNCIGIGIDSGQTTFRLLHNDGSGSATATDLGANFPANTSATDFYELMLWWDDGASVVNYQLVRENTGHIAQGQISTNLPSATQILSAQVIGNTRTGSAAIGISWSRVAGHHG